MSDNAADVMPFAKLMGVQVEEATKERVRAHLVVREDLCTTGGILHGGAIMAFADALGAIGAFLTLPEGAKGTTTIESKTNFLGPAPQGKKVIGETTPVKVGRTLSVWQTRITLEGGRDVAVVTQTQLVL
ncbi:PaaI family thioesterase [Phenylobacterium sp.]|uniref:PaaI family thioesterase n=1 Tax=Phenylobacterium sp. TaxID=1871053 RepID=UPI002FDDF33D